jgi:carboxyl-terminal processing protease
MPDYFVPLDTALNSRYLNELYTTNSLPEYTFNYAEEHKTELQKMGYENFYKNFVVTPNMLDRLVTIGKRNGAEPDYKDLARNRKVFQVHVKAQIARKIWNNNGFFPIFNETNEILQQAVRMFDRVPEVSRKKR